jgi:Family of unknown function (DUF5681)
MGGYLNKIGFQGHPLDTDVRVLIEPRTVPYTVSETEAYAYRIRAVSTVSQQPTLAFPEFEPSSYDETRSGDRGSKQQGISMTIGKPFKKGQSGNPGGRPKVLAEVKELARAHTGEAIETLVSIMTNPKSAPAARVSAANSLLDRGYGKPPQHITGEGGPSYVIRAPEPCKTAEEWVARLGDPSSPTQSNGQRGEAT